MKCSTIDGSDHCPRNFFQCESIFELFLAQILATILFLVKSCNKAFGHHCKEGASRGAAASSRAKRYLHDGSGASART